MNFIQSVIAVGLALAVGACVLSPDDPLDDAQLVMATGVDCATVPLDYDTFGRQFLSNYCLRCHGAARVSDVQRSDAPVGIDFDTLEQAQPFAARIRLRAGELGDMPPALLGGPRPSDAERIELLQWIDCGMP